jgi:hypothetical protein
MLGLRITYKTGYVTNTPNIYLWRQGLSAFSSGHPMSASKDITKKINNLVPAVAFKAFPLALLITYSA